MEVSNKKTVLIDLKRTTKIPALEFYKDDTNEIVFELSNDNAYVNLSDLTAVMSNLRRSDGEVISKKLKVSGHKAFYKMNAEEMAVTGEAIINLQLFEGTDRLTVVTMPLTIKESFGARPETITNAESGEEVAMSDVDVTVYLKKEEAEKTYRKIESKITEEDLHDDVKAKLGSGSPTTTTAADSVPEKWFVVCVAGQSNAIGYDESPVSNVISKNLNPNRIRQLGLYDEHNLELVPLGHHADSYEDVRGRTNPKSSDKKGPKGIHLPLANLLLDEIPEDYGVLMISTAYGGTGFTKEGRSTGVDDYNAEKKKPNTAARPTGQYNWGKESAYFYGMRDRIKHALDLNPENIFGGVVWIQGEEDHADPTGHKAGFTAMTTEFFRYFNEEGEGKYKKQVAKGEWDKDLWYNVETVNYFYEELNADAVWQNYKDFNLETYVEIPRDTDSNVINGTSGPETPMAKGHFGNDAYTRVIAPRVFKKMAENGALIKGVVPTSAAAASASSSTTTSVPVNDPDMKEKALEANDFARVGANSAGTFDGGVIKFTNEPTGWTSNLDFKGAYKLTYDAAQKDYVIAFRGDINDDWNAIRVGNVNPGQLYEYIGGTLKALTTVPSANYALQDGDQVQVTLDDKGVLDIKVKKKAEEGQGFQQWAQVNTKQSTFRAPDKRALGFVFGANATNSQLPPNDAKTVMKNVKIQKKKQEYTTQTTPTAAAAAPSKPDSVIGSAVYLISNKGPKHVVGDTVYVVSGTTITKSEYPQLFAFLNRQDESLALPTIADLNGMKAYICVKN